MAEDNMEYYSILLGNGSDYHGIQSRIEEEAAPGAGLEGVPKSSTKFLC